MFKKNIIKKILVGCTAALSIGFTYVIAYTIGILLNSGSVETHGVVIAGALFALNSTLALYGCYALWKRVSA